MKTLIFICCLLTAGLASVAQSDSGYSIEGDNGRRDTNTDWMDKIYVGGGIGGLSFSQNQIYASFSLLGGYRWTEKLNTGVGYTYQYTSYKDVNISLHNHGVNVFTQYMIYKPIFLMAQYEYLSFQGLYTDLTTYRDSYNSVMLGGGYSQQLSKKAAINFYVLYDVTYDKDRSPYGTPWYIGLNFAVGF